MNASIEKMNEGVEMYNRASSRRPRRSSSRPPRIEEENHSAWYNLGQAREKLDKYKEAAEAFGEAVKIQAGRRHVPLPLGKALVGEDCTPGQESNLELAQTQLEEAVKPNGRLYKAWECLGQIYALQRRAEGGGRRVDQVGQPEPVFGKPFIALGKLYIKWDKLQEAISVLDQGRLNVKDLSEQSDLLYHLGLAYEKQGNFDKAIEAYSQAIEKKTENLDARRQRGFAYAGRVTRRRRRSTSRRSSRRAAAGMRSSSRRRTSA